MSRQKSANRSLSREPSRRESQFSGNASVSSVPSNQFTFSRAKSASPGMLRREASRRESSSTYAGRPLFRASSVPDVGSIASERPKLQRSGSQPTPELYNSSQLKNSPKRSGRASYTSATRRYLRENVHRPPKSLLIVWFIVLGQLMLDLVTTIMSYIQLNQDWDCCGYKGNIGPIPKAVTDPYLVLIMLELSFLFRSMFVTLFPKSAEAHSETRREKKRRSCLPRMLFACMKWNATMILEGLELSLILNPFFGAAVAWILLYQTSKNWAFAALALQGTTQGEYAD